MLNEKVTISVCGKSYRLRTDDARLLTSMAAEVEKRITDYCHANGSMEKDDAAIFAALDLLSDIHTLREECSSLEQERDALKKKQADFELSAEEYKALKAASEELKKESSELADLRSRYGDLEKELFRLKSKAGSSAKNDKEADNLKKQLHSVEERNSRLVSEAKDAAAKLSEKEQKLAAVTKELESLKKNSADMQVKLDSDASEQLEKKIAALEKENAQLKGDLDKTVTSSKAASEQVSELNGTIKNYEEACADAANRASALEKEKAELEAKVKELEDTAVELKQQLRSSADKVADLSRKSDKLEELMVKFSQTESENAALKACSENAEASAGRLEEAEKELAELRKKTEEFERANRELKRTNASLNQQLNEMLEDGQLTL